MPQVVRRRGHRFARKDFVVDGPQIEVVLGCILLSEGPVLGFRGSSIRFGEPEIAPVKMVSAEPRPVRFVPRIFHNDAPSHDPDAETGDLKNKHFGASVGHPGGRSFAATKVYSDRGSRHGSEIK